MKQITRESFHVVREYDFARNAAVFPRGERLYMNTLERGAFLAALDEEDTWDSIDSLAD